MSSVKILDVKLVASCSKHRTADEEVPKNKNGRQYLDEELACVECSFEKKETKDLTSEETSNDTKPAKP